MADKKSIEVALKKLQALRKRQAGLLKEQEKLIQDIASWHDQHSIAALRKNIAS